MRDPSLIRDGLGRRRSAPPSDKVQIGFDTAHDHLTAYCFEANASGVQNVVLRWEYVRGSTLFAVWNLSTSDEAARRGIFSPLRDLRGAFRAPGANVFAIKFSYWFAP